MIALPTQNVASRSRKFTPEGGRKTFSKKYHRWWSEVFQLTTKLQSLLIFPKMLRDEDICYRISIWNEVGDVELGWEIFNLIWKCNAEYKKFCEAWKQLRTTKPGTWVLPVHADMLRRSSIHELVVLCLMPARDDSGRSACQLGLGLCTAPPAKKVPHLAGFSCAKLPIVIISS